MVTPVHLLDHIDIRIAGTLATETEPISGNDLNGSPSPPPDSCRLDREMALLTLGTEIRATGLATFAERASRDQSPVTPKTNQPELRHLQSSLQVACTAETVVRSPFISALHSGRTRTLAGVSPPKPAAGSSNDLTELKEGNEFGTRTARLFGRKVFHEERNASQCSPARGKSNRHHRRRRAGRTVCRTK